MTPEFILRASISRILSPANRSEPSHHRAFSALDEISVYSDSVSWNHIDKGIVVADWNAFPREVAGIIESYGYEIDWQDECTSCGECGKHIHTSPECYGDTPRYVIMNECEIVCEDCLDAEEYLESIEDNPRTALNLRGIDPEEYGYVKIKDGFENGFYAGQTDDPKEIFADLQQKKYKHIIFSIDSQGQFDIRFSVWYRQNYEVIVGSIGSVYEGHDAKKAHRVFEEYAEQSRTGYGRAAGEDVTVFCNDEIEAEHHIEHVHNFVDGECTGEDCYEQEEPE
jgi:hypothetical protein